MFCKECQYWKYIFNIDYERYGKCENEIVNHLIFALRPLLSENFDCKYGLVKSEGKWHD